jgi:hypothetical protein
MDIKKATVILLFALSSTLLIVCFSQYWLSHAYFTVDFDNPALEKSNGFIVPYFMYFGANYIFLKEFFKKTIRQSFIWGGYLGLCAGFFGELNSWGELDSGAMFMQVIMVFFESLCRLGWLFGGLLGVINNLYYKKINT